MYCSYLTLPIRDPNVLLNTVNYDKKTIINSREITIKISYIIFDFKTLFTNISKIAL